MRILLLGADGQVGFELQRSLSTLGVVLPATLSGKLPDGRVCALSDLIDVDATLKLVRESRADWIVNAAAYTAVDRAEDEVEVARRINAEALADIAAEAKKRNATVVHFSTDYVFGGAGSRPFMENDPAAPINVYGRTKFDGEQALRDAGVRHLILRTAWVYGSRGHNFLLTMLKLAASRDRLTVVDDQTGTPTTARLLANVAACAMSALRGAEPGDPRFGTYHVTASGFTTWHGFASAIIKGARQAGLLQRAVKVDPIASADFPTKAKRPSWSVLDCGKLEKTFGVHLPDWREGLSATIAELVEARRQGQS